MGTGMQVESREARPPLPPPRWLWAGGRSGGIRIATCAAGAAQGAHRRPSSPGQSPLRAGGGSCRLGRLPLGPRSHRSQCSGHVVGGQAPASKQHGSFGWDARANAGGQLPKRSDCWRLLGNGAKRLRALDACCGSASPDGPCRAAQQPCKQPIPLCILCPLAALTRSARLCPASFRAKGALPGACRPLHRHGQVFRSSTV